MVQSEFEQLESKVLDNHLLAFQAAIDLEQLLPHGKINGRGFSHAHQLGDVYGGLSNIPDTDIVVGNYFSQIYHRFFSALHGHEYPQPEFTIPQVKETMREFSTALGELPVVRSENFNPERLYDTIYALTFLKQTL